MSRSGEVPQQFDYDGEGLFTYNLVAGVNLVSPDPYSRAALARYVEHRVKETVRARLEDPDAAMYFVDLTFRMWDDLTAAGLNLEPARQAAGTPVRDLQLEMDTVFTLGTTTDPEAYAFVHVADPSGYVRLQFRTRFGALYCLD